MSIPIEVELKAKGGIKIEGAGGDAGGGGAVGGNAAGMVGAVAKGVVIAQLALGALRGIADNMVKSSGALQGVFKMFEMAMLILFKPLGDFLATLLRPVAIALLYFVFSFAKLLQKGLNALGEFLSPLLAPIADFIKSLVGAPGEDLKEELDSVAETLKDGIKDAVTPPTGEGEGPLPKTTAFLEGAIFAEIEAIFLGRIETLKTQVTEMFDRISTKLGEISPSVISLADIALPIAGAVLWIVWNTMLTAYKMALGTLEFVIMQLLAMVQLQIDLVLAILNGEFDKIPGIILDYFAQVLENLDNLYNTMKTAIEELFAAWAPIIDALLSMLPDEIEPAVRGFFNAISDAIKDLKQAVSSWISDQLDKLKDVARGVGEALGFGGKQVGSGYIPSDGLYYLHRGENVVSNTQKGMGATTVNNSISINATVSNDYDVDRLAEELQRKMNEKMWRNSTYTNSYI